VQKLLHGFKANTGPKKKNRASDYEKESTRRDLAAKNEEPQWAKQSRFGQQRIPEKNGHVLGGKYAKSYGGEGGKGGEHFL